MNTQYNRTTLDYYLKIVNTEYRKLDDTVINTYQYTSTTYTN